MRRVSVVGNSGSGKTTVATGIAQALAVPHLELDAVERFAQWIHVYGIPLESGRYDITDSCFVYVDSDIVEVHDGEGGELEFDHQAAEAFSEWAQQLGLA